MIKHGSTIAGYFVPVLSAVNVSGAINTFTNSQDTIFPTAVNQSIEYLQSLSSKDSEEQDPAKDTATNSFTGQEVLEGADLRHLEAFIKSKDQHQALGNLYRTITQDGHVKWVCITHYRLGYKKRDQEVFVTAVELNGGHHDPHLGKATVKLGSKIQAAGFFDALAKARRVDELVVTFDWRGTTSDLVALGDTLKSGSYCPSDGSRPAFQLSTAATTSLSPKLSFEVAKWGGLEELGKTELRRLAETLKTNSTLATLKFWKNSIENSEVVALSNVSKYSRRIIPF
ncbi:hypothetical protein BGZ47_006564 [Haplosporangium gracile]|nr:hypothetical protein BGZ47_006564 [Haplosporangium gracile]